MDVKWFKFRNKQTMGSYRIGGEKNIYVIDIPELHDNKQTDIKKV